MLSNPSLLSNRSMLSNKYYNLISSHRFLTNKVAVCDLAFSLTTHCTTNSYQFSSSELKGVVCYVFRKIPKYTYIVLQKIVNQIFPNRSSHAQEDRRMEQDMHEGLVAVFIAKQATFSIKDSEIFRDRAQQVFIRLMDRFGVNAKNSLLRAYFQFYQGELSSALQLTKNLLEIVHPSQDFIRWNCHLLTAQIYFARRLYQKCIDELKICFRMHNDLPIKARLAMAHSYFHLGNYQKAEAIFKRILSLDSRCLEAVIGLAVICQRNQDYQDYFHCLKIANKEHPLIILHIAEHLLMINELERAREFAERGLKAIKRMSRINHQRQSIRDDYFEYQGRFWNIIGQIYHMEGKYGEALRWYCLLSRRGLSCNVWSKYQIAQCYVGLQLYKEANYVMEALYQQYHDYFAKIYKQARPLGDTFRLMACLKLKLQPIATEGKKIQSYFLQSIKFDKNSPWIHFELSQYYHLQSEHKKALVQFKHGYELMAAQKIDVTAQIYNNLAVLYLQNDHLEDAATMLDQSLNKLQSQTELEQPTAVAIKTVVLYNSAIVAQEKKSIATALKIYQQTLQTNSLYIDAMLRLAYCYLHHNNKQMSDQVLLKAIQMTKQCQQQSKIKDHDRALILKAYIQWEADQLENSLQSINQIKQQDSYHQLLKIGILYRTHIRQSNNSNLDQLKKLGSQLQAIAQQDSHNIFAIANLLTINLTIRHMDRDTEQMKQYQVYIAFGQLKSHIHKQYLSSIDYNTALFSLRANNISSAIALLKELRKNYPTPQINSLSVYCQLRAKQLGAACKLAKLNFLLFPNDIIARYQLQSVVLDKCRERVDGVREKSRGQELVRQVELLRYCDRLFKYCALIQPDWYRRRDKNTSSEVVDKLKVVSEIKIQEVYVCDMKCHQQLINAQQTHKRQPTTAHQQQYHLSKRFKHNGQSK